MDILNSNDYKRGFADGQKDAEASKDPNYIRMGLSGKFVIHGTASLDSYARGYNDGYREAMRKSIVQKVEVVNTSTDKDSTNARNVTANRVINHQLTSGNMSNLQSIELQIDALEKMEQLLLNTIEDLRSRMQTYNEKATALLEEGLPVEILKEYEDDFLQPNNQRLKSLTEEMENNDLKYIRDSISHLNELKDFISHI